MSVFTALEECVFVAPLARAKQKYQKTELGLAALTELCFSIKLSKDNSIRCSSWDLLPYSSAQVLYAASDAFYSQMVFLFAVKSMKQNAAPTQLPFSCPLFNPGKDNDEHEQSSFERLLQCMSISASLPKWCPFDLDLIVDRPCVTRQKSNRKDSGVPRLAFSTTDPTPDMPGPQGRIWTCATVEGKFLFCCPEKRAQWLITQGLAVPVGPMIIRIARKRLQTLA